MPYVYTLVQLKVDFLRFKDRSRWGLFPPYKSIDLYTLTTEKENKTKQKNQILMRVLLKPNGKKRESPLLRKLLS